MADFNQRGGFARGRGGYRGSRGANRYGARRDGTVHDNYKRPILLTDLTWRDWTKVQIKIPGLPPQCLPQDVYQLVKKHDNNIEFIKIINHMAETGPKCVAFVTFQPPPRHAFWSKDKPIGSTSNGSPVFAEVVNQPHSATYESPRDPDTKFPESMSTPVSGLDFGFASSFDAVAGEPTKLTIMRSIPNIPPSSTMLSLNLKYRELVLSFEVDLSFLGETSQASQEHGRNSYWAEPGKWKIVIPFKQLGRTYVLETDPNFAHLIIPVSNPPKFFRRVTDPTTTMGDSNHELKWSAHKAWFRQTELLKKQEALQLVRSSLNLHKEKPFIDIGAWNTYRITIPKHVMQQDKVRQLLLAMLDFNIPMYTIDRLDVQIGKETKPDMWEALDGGLSTSTSSGLNYGDVFERHIHLAWEVRYQLEVCISNGLINPYDITIEFLKTLQNLQQRKAVRLLEHIADLDRHLTPTEVLNQKVPYKKQPKVPQYCTLQRSVKITPSQIIYSSPTVEVSNRILRQYRDHADRFLRVRFVDEKPEGKIYSRNDETHDPLFNRVHRCLQNGITIGDRHFEYLAAGNSQFKEHGAFFFAPTADLSAETIRDWMGDFRKLNVVAKYSSRMGQCYSTTRAVNCGRVEIKEMSDVKASGSYVFTDGVGMISPLLAYLTAHDLNIDEVPSAFQFRLGGCKGVLAVWDKAKGSEIHIRESQYKFPAHHEGLEIVRYAGWSPAQLNRQLITNLCCLGVPNHVFVSKMREELSDIDTAMRDEKKAITLLEKRIDVNQTTITIANMLRAGLKSDPFVASILQLWRAWRHKTLKEKANITITEGAFLIGCTDETKTLRGHYDNSPTLPEIFLQVEDKDHPGSYKIIEGICCLMRNPSLHPGDVRVVKAVDVAALHHLKNVVVFPQTGDRDIPSMCSGGDLDGDDYYVAWDKALIPREWNHEPMQQPESAKPQVVDKVSMTDISNFHVKFMKQDSLGQIANAWLGLADHVAGGPKSYGCIRLAQEHSTAVDFGKTGQPADNKVMQNFGPQMYPHYMERKSKIYHSKTACGQLYDMVKRLEFKPLLRNAFDKRILDFFYEQQDSISEDTIRTIISLKNDYDVAMLRIMRQWEVDTEFEIWTAFIMEHSKLAKAYEIQTEIGRLAEFLLTHHREECTLHAGGSDEDRMAPFVAAMYKITADQTAAQLKKLDQFQQDEDAPPRPHDMPLVSFPWLFHRELCNITRHSSKSQRNVSAHSASSYTSHSRKPVAGPQPVKTPTGTTAAGDVLALFQGVQGSNGPPMTSYKGARTERYSAPPNPDDFLDYDEFYDAKESLSPVKQSPGRGSGAVQDNSIAASLPNVLTKMDLNPSSQVESQSSQQGQQTTLSEVDEEDSDHAGTEYAADDEDDDVDDSDAEDTTQGGRGALGRLAALYRGKRQS